VRQLRGETRPSRTRIEPQPPDRPPEPPDSLTPAARAVWDRLVSDFAAMGILFAVDSDPLAMLCSSVATFHAADQALAEQGHIVVDDHGAPRRNPWIMIRRDAVAEIQRLGSAFGMTPVARAHLAAPAKQSDEHQELASRYLS